MPRLSRWVSEIAGGASRRTLPELAFFEHSSSTPARLPYSGRVWRRHRTPLSLNLPLQYALLRGWAACVFQPFPAFCPFEDARMRFSEHPHPSLATNNLTESISCPFLQ